VRDGSLISTRPTAGFYWYPIGIDGQGRAVARMMLRPDSLRGPGQGYVRFPMTGESSDTTMVPERPEPEGLKQWAVGEGDRINFMRQVPLRPRGVHAIDPTGGFVTGWSGEYALVASANGGDTAMVFRRPFTAEPVTAAQKADIVEQVIAGFDFNQMGVTEEALRKAFDPTAIPDERPAFEGIWVDREGRRWVRLSNHCREVRPVRSRRPLARPAQPPDDRLAPRGMATHLVRARQSGRDPRRRGRAAADSGVQDRAEGRLARTREREKAGKRESEAASVSARSLALSLSRYFAFSRILGHAPPTHRRPRRARPLGLRRPRQPRHWQ
jgi:hypothetical protein